MKGYVLTDRGIRILVGAAGNAVCEDHDFSEEQEKMIMGMSAEIALKLIGHLSGADPFPEDVLEITEALMEILGGGEDNDVLHERMPEQGMPGQL